MPETQLFRHAVSLIALVAIVTSTPALTAQELSKEGQNQKAIHEFLFDTFLEGRKTVYQGNGRNRGLKELTILQETEEIHHGAELLLPEGTQRIAALFRHFGIHGANLDRIKASTRTL